MHVHRALRPAGGARRVDHHHRRLRVERRRGQLGARAARRPPPSARSRPACIGGSVPSRSWTITVCTAGAAGQRLVGQRLDGHRLAAAGDRVAGDQRDRAGVRQPSGDGGRAEAGEDRHGDRADLADRVERRHHLDAHRQEQPDGLALRDAARQQRVGDPVGQRLQLGVGDGAHLAVLALGDHRRVVGPLAGVAVDAVGRQVDPAAAEPGRPHRPARVVEHRVVRRRELDAQVADDRVPEPADVVTRAAAQLLPAVDPVLAHERAGAGVLDDARRRLPDPAALGAHAIAAHPIRQVRDSRTGRRGRRRSARLRAGRHCRRARPDPQPACHRAAPRGPAIPA